MTSFSNGSVSNDSCENTQDLTLLLAGRKRILVTGGAGFIGSAVVRRLLRQSDATVYNLDKMGYASDLTSIEAVLAAIAQTENADKTTSRHQLLKVDLCDPVATTQAVQIADPYLVMHLAAESHVDRSISGPGEVVEKLPETSQRQGGERGKIPGVGEITLEKMEFFERGEFPEPGTFQRDVVVVGQVVDPEHFATLRLGEAAGDVVTDEAGGAGHKDFHSAER